MKPIQNFLLLFFVVLTFSCKQKTETNEIEKIITVNALDISLRAENDKGYEIQSIPGDDGTVDHLRITVSDEYAARGKTSIKLNKPYKLSVTLKNEDANPLVLYSFWKGPVTSVRSFAMAGKMGNPPSSETQKKHTDWVTFEQIIEAREGEDSFMLTILSQKGTFYLKEVKIEEAM